MTSISIPLASRKIGLTITLFFVFLLVFAIYAYTEKQIDRANERRLISYALADQLRQSSDELTRMAKAYVVTGEPRYKKYFQDIIDIRNGSKPRPEKYFYAYWDLVVANVQSPPSDSGKGVALLDLMRQSGFTAEELGKLAVAKLNSDDLSTLENEAMKLAESVGANAQAHRFRAILMLHGEKYIQAKTRVMRPINDFFHLMDARTLAEVHRAEILAMWLRILSTLIAFGAIFMLLKAYAALHRILGGSADEIHAYMFRIGHGEFSPPIAVHPDQENSVLAGLADMQQKLLAHETDRRQKELELQKFQAIVDSSDDAIISKTLDGIIQSWNRGAANIFGYQAAEVIGRPMQILIPADRLNDEPEILSRIARGEKVEHFETVRRCKDGKLIDISATISPIFDAQGKAIGVSKIARDITERKIAEEQLRVAAATFETHEAILITDANANIIRVNQAFQDITGYTSEEALGKNPRILKSGQHDQAFYEAMWQQLLSAGTWTGEIWDRRKSGQIYPKWMTVTAVKNEQGHTTGYVAIFSDITERKKAEEEIRSLAFYDALTNLPNRRLLLDRFRLALSVSARSHCYGSVLFLDMDKFKTLNDTLGHDYGDLMLIEVARRIQGCVREVDTVARLGGDEFVVLIEEIGASAENASQKVALIAEKIRASLSATYLLKGHEHHSSPSIGVCLYCGNAETVDTLLKHADLAMYQAKESGRNAVRFYNPTMQMAVKMHADLEAGLRHAVPGKQLRLYYQIQIDSDHRPLGAEALVRWIHPEYGMVLPGQFIPIAEESSLIIEVGNWVLETACRQLARWSKQAQLRDMVLAVNVSSQQFRKHDFVEGVVAVLRSNQVDPARLKLELTESVVLSDVTDVVAKMHQLKALGIKLSLDDFGTGYSSLSYLKQLPLDQIKIDQSFVRDISTDNYDAIMVKTIIDMAQNFGLQVIAEGVETDAQLAFLRQHGCLTYQGYLFGKPMPVEEFEGLITQNDKKLVA